MSPTSIGKKRVSFQRRKAASPATPAPAARPVADTAPTPGDTAATPPPEPPIPKSIPARSFQDAWRQSPGAWFESYAYVYDKDRNLRASELATKPEELLHLNQMQQELDEIVVYCDMQGIPCRIVTLKGRQQGSSTWSTAALYHACRKKRTKACIIGDVYERSVANLLAMFNLFAKKDKFGWGSTYDRPSKKFSNGSELVTETANANRAGASGTLQAVLCTEVAHWLETPGISAKSVFAALLSCVPPKKGTLVIVESTPNGVGGVYYDTYQKAISFDDLKAGRVPKDWNGFIRVFYPWHQHPEYTLPVTEIESQEIMAALSDREQELVDEFEHIRAARLKWRRMKINSPDFNGDEERFEQEYPSDPERCFLLSGRRSFPLLQLQQMLKRAEREGQAGLHPKALRWTDARETMASMVPASDEEAWIKIWEEPKPGYRYSVSVDPCTGAAHGTDSDNHSIGVWRSGFYDTYGKWMPPKLVARVTDYLAEKRLMHQKAFCQWDIYLTEQRIAMAAAYYGWCQIVIESNMDKGLIEALKLRSKANLYIRQIFNRTQQTTTTTEIGWLTNEKTRRPMLELLKRMVRTWEEEGGGVEILDAPCIREMMTMIVDKTGREEAMRGHHDDQVLQAAIGVQTLGGATMMPFPIQRRQQTDPTQNSTYRP